MVSNIDADDWTELSHPIHEQTVGMPFLPQPAIEPEPEPTMRATKLTMATHVGTHIEGPFHLFDEGKRIDEYDIGTWIGRGVVCEVDADRLDEISYDDLNDVVDELKPADALLLRTGWDAHAGNERYYEPPYLSREVVDWIVERDISWVGVDSPSPEMPPTKRGTGFDYPVHGTLFENDVAIGENLTNLDLLANQVIDVVAMPLSISGREAAPARIAGHVR